MLSLFFCQPGPFFSVNLVPFWSFFCEKSGPFLVPIRDFFLQGPDLSSLMFSINLVEIANIKNEIVNDFIIVIMTSTICCDKILFVNLKA